MTCRAAGDRGSSGARRSGRRGSESKGKQPGSPGAAMRWEVPDRTEDYYPPAGDVRGRPGPGAGG